MEVVDSNSLSNSQNQSSVNEVLTPLQRAEFHLERARQLIVVGTESSIELERALVETSKALSFITDDSKYYMFLAKVYKKSLDISSALFCYRYTLKLEPNNEMAIKFFGDMLLLKGKELMITGANSNSSSKFQSAKHCFEEYLELNKEHCESWFLKAVCHIKVKENAEAFECVTRAIKNSTSTNVEYYILRAKLLWAKGLIEQGNTDIRIASSKDPDHPEVISFCQRSYKKAERLYKLCVSDFTKGNYTLALNYCRHALSITTEDVKLHIMIAKIHRVMGDLQSAYTSILRTQEIFERASGNSFTMNLPNDIVRQMNLILNEVAIKYATEGDYEKAILLLNRIIKIERDIAQGGLLSVDFKYFLNRGDCYRALNQMSDAIFDYEQALELESENWDIRTRLSLTHYLNAVDFYNKSNYRQAERHLDSAIKYNPKVAGYYALRGKSSYYNYDFQKSYQDFRKTLELDSSNEEIRTRLAQFEIQSEDGTSSGVVDDDIPDTFGRRLPANAKVTSSDMIDMMLNPKEARKLPTIKLKAAAADDTQKRPHGQARHLQIISADSAAVARSSGEYSGIGRRKIAGENANSKTLSITAIPSVKADHLQYLNVSPHFAQSFIAATTVQANVNKLHRVFEKKTVHPKAKSDMWTVMATAGKLAFDRSHPKGYTMGEEK